MAYPSMNKSYMQTKYNATKCSNRRTGKKVKYIAVHYTGTTASAKNNCIYFSNANRNASADYFIDTDGTIYKFNGNCACYYTWHCGDSKGKYGITNANSIGIEVVSKGGEFTAKQQASLQKLVTAIMADYGVAAANVVRHYDASRKKCPAPYCGSTAKDKKWKELHASIITTGSIKTTTTVKTTAKVATTASKLTVDGVMGKNTIKALQKAVGVTADGVKGKNTIKALQKFLNKKGYSLTVDGVQGKNTNKALQKFLTKQGYKVAADGVVGANTIKALQKCLNAGKFK